MTPLSELQQRSAALQQLLQQQGVDGALIVQNSDLFYFTGSIQRGAFYLPADGEPVYLVVKDFSRARMESGLKHVEPMPSLRKLPEKFGDLNIPRPAIIGMELDVLPVLQYRRYQDILTDVQIVDVSSLIRQVRAVKSDYEIAIMQDGAVIAEKTFEYAKEIISAGRSDIEIAAELECFASKEGHQGVVRFRAFNSELHFGHVLSGGDGAVPAYLDAPLGGLGVTPAVGHGASYKTIAAGEPIIIDFIIAYDGYLVDQTRTVVVGAASEQLKTAYADMVSIQSRMYELARPGMAWGELYGQCYEMACELGYRDHFMGSAGSQVSFIGHGVGIEVDEYPFIAKGFDNQLLQKNMTFAFEPKAVFPGLGAVGIENTWQVTSTGLKRLTFANEVFVEL